MVFQGATIESREAYMSTGGVLIPNGELKLVLRTTHFTWIAGAFWLIWDGWEDKEQSGVTS